MDNTNKTKYIYNNNNIIIIKTKTTKRKCTITISVMNITGFRNSVNNCNKSEIYISKTKKISKSNRMKSNDYMKMKIDVNDNAKNNVKNNVNEKEDNEDNNENLDDDSKEDIKTKTIKTHSISNKKRNKRIKIKNGNINNNRIKIVQWNKGSCKILNGMIEIREIIKNRKPDVFIINEFNLEEIIDKKIVNIDGYNLELDNLDNNRTAMYIRRNLIYNREKIYEGKGESVICVKIGYPRKRKIYITGYYRQWKKTEESIYRRKIQNQRFDTQTKLWDNMMKDKPGTESIIMGDFNINAKIMNKSNNELTEYEKSFIPMIKMIEARLLNNGMKMITENNTRNNTILDHVYTNKIEKIEKINIDEDSMADHHYVEIIRKMKIDQMEETKIETRNYKIIDYEIINNNIINNNNYIRMLEEEDVNYVAENLINVINEELEAQSKMKIITIKEEKDKTNKYSEETLKLIKKKNELYKENSVNKTTENTIELKNIKIEIKTRKTKEDFIYKKNKFSENQNNPKKAWSQSKELLYGKRQDFPDRIIENNIIRIGSKKVSNTMNRFYINKINKIEREMEPQKEDPMIS